MSRELVLRVTIADCEVQTFRAGGPGGQNQNKRNSAARVKHPPSGAVGESREARGQLENKRRAFRRMAESAEFQTWVRLTAMKYPSIDEVVSDLMQSENLTIEGVDEKGRWAIDAIENNEAGQTRRFEAE